MKKYFFATLVIAILTGCPHTSIDPIDRRIHTENVCEQSFTVSNSSSKQIDIHMDIVVASSDRHCDNDGDHQVISVPPGQSGTVRANINCEICDIDETYSVDSADPTISYTASKSKFSSDGNSGSESAFCNDQGCTGT